MEQHQTVSAGGKYPVPSYIPQITGVRAIAAFMVYLHHFPTGHSLLPESIFRMTMELHTGVGLFFVLSGYLIYQRYYESCVLNKQWWGNYIKNRIARIYPMYFLLTFITLLNKTLRHGDADTLLWFLNLSFLRGFSQEFYMTGVSQGWTLTVEECFYFSAPLFFLVIKRRGGQSFWQLIAGLYVLGLLLWGIGEFVSLSGFFQGSQFMITYTFFGRCFEFFAGMFLARQMVKKDWYRPSTSWGTITVIALSGITFSIWLMSQFQSSEYHYGLRHPLGIMINNLMLPIFYALLFLGLIREKTIVQRFLGSQIFVLLGKSSYIFYLTHMGIVQALVARVVCPETFTPVTTLQYLSQFILLNTISIVLYLYVEDPLNHLIRRRWKTGAR